jgi:hypothetical protein
MALQSVRFRVRLQKLSNVGQSLDYMDQKFIILSSSVHHSALGPRGGLWPVLRVIHKEGVPIVDFTDNDEIMMIEKSTIQTLAATEHCRSPHAYLGCVSARILAMLHLPAAAVMYYI